MRIDLNRIIVAAGGLCAVAWSVSAAAQSGNDSVIYLNQGWSQADREMYYQTSQGSAAMSYDIYLNLEVAGSQELFRSNANSERFGLTPQAANPRTNPDALPVGVTKTVVTEPRWKGTYAGLNCAACHNSQLNYKGKRIRIDGGVGAFDMMGYVGALDDAMQATIADASKFARLAKAIGISTPAAESELRQRAERDAARVHEYRSVTIQTPLVYGPHRMDAVSSLIGRLTMTEPGIRENWFPSLAPTKIPFLWNAPQSSWVQWRAEQQSPLRRNMVEVGGVFLFMDLRSKTPEEGLFNSAAELLNVAKIEDALNRLAPPKWPEEILGKLDRGKVRAGEALFAENCAKCHNKWPYGWTEPNKYGKRWIEVGLVPQTYVGTDPGQFADTLPYALTKQLAPYLLGDYKDKPIAPTGVLYVSLQERIDAAAVAKLKLSEEELIKINGYREFPLPPPPYRVYKAAPRDGVWATPPFMHNGSVPNLYEMLVPADERTKKFYVGREFDPVKVGVDTSGSTGFLLDTSVRGNSNAGHSFEDKPLGNGVVGRKFTDDERWALVEYLKSIPEEAGRVTPFGGPADAKTGNQPWGKAPPR
ncbi:di-heme-cytochrome C peroxidase [Variovorax humicola]|uniref:Di-heme-cytochrome C peroxidase n=1 Tax=Variovorax humicola TaxID=1769758 RepID=A0ABU8VXM5_9BURK